MKKNFNESTQENKYSIHNCKSKLIQYIRNFIISKSADLIDINSLFNVIIGDSEYNKIYYKYFKGCAILVNVSSMILFSYTCIFNFLGIYNKLFRWLLLIFFMFGIIVWDIRLYIDKKEKDNFIVNALNFYKLVYFVFAGGILLYYIFIFVVNTFRNYKSTTPDWFDLPLSLLLVTWILYVITWFIEYISLRKKYKKELYIKSHKVSNKISVTLYIVSFIFLFFTLILSSYSYMMNGQIDNQQIFIGMAATILMFYSLIIISKNYYFLKNNNFKLTNIGNIFVSALPVILKFISDILEKQMK